VKPYSELLRLIAEGQSNTNVRLVPAVRGFEWGPYTLTIDGDLSTASPYGAINGRPNDATPITEFDFTSGTFDGEKTTFEYSLTGTKTALFPATQRGADEFVFDIAIDGVGIVGGVLPVRGFITEAQP
jgi:hypothetical protein